MKQDRMEKQPKVFYTLKREVIKRTLADNGAWTLDRPHMQYIGARDGWLAWQDDLETALHLQRREDADMLANCVEECWQIGEHKVTPRIDWDYWLPFAGGFVTAAAVVYLIVCAARVFYN